MARLTFFGPDGSRRTTLPDLYDDPSPTLEKILGPPPESDPEEDDGDPEHAKEEALQTLVERHPEVLPWEAWASRTGDDGQKVLPTVLSICRGVAGIPLDILLLEAWHAVSGVVPRIDIKILARLVEHCRE